ncbi:MAG: GNAT family N-acetyltransferase [Bacteroidales bacterium]|nr:GNAT family N-acetyltransferase [Bacteroidales bacterium]
MENILVKEVESKSDLRKFIAFPDKLYKGNKYRVPQLHMYEKAALMPEKNSAFEFCEAKYWLAYKNNKIVGRIAAIINHKSNEIWNEKHMRFGWIDFIDDLEVSGALIKTVEGLAKEKGMTAVHGPLGFSDMDLEGMLIKGFDEIATQATIYNYPYYPVHLEKLGYSKDTDWVQFEIKVPDKVPEKLKRISSLVLEKYNLRILETKKPKDLLPYAKSMFYTLNDAFKSLYGFVPLTDKQIEQYTKDYFSAIDVKYVCFVLDENDEVAGFGISFLSLSKALQKANGKLFPTGFIHVLKALRKNNKVDMLLQAVKPEYQNKGVAAIFYTNMMQAYIDNGIEIAISSHALEDNKSAFLMFKNYEIRQHLKRRCYIKKGV